MLGTLSSGFGAVVLLLSVIGLYGVIPFVLTSDARDRHQNGARSYALRDAAGTAIALPCVWALGRLLEAQLFGVRAVDGLTIAASMNPAAALRV